jgi:hypothetical protein
VSQVRQHTTLSHINLPQIEDESGEADSVTVIPDSYLYQLGIRVHWTRKVSEIINAKALNEIF